MLLDLDIVIGFKLERISIYFVVVVVVLVYLLQGIKMRTV